MANFELCSLLGRGACGSIYALSSTEVLKRTQDEDGLYSPLEIDILFRLHHPNLLAGLQLLIPPHGDADFTQEEVGLILPRYKMDLEQALLEKELDIATRWNYFLQICRGIQFLHANGIGHMDLKAANILVDGQQAVIADFGLARLMTAGQTTSYYPLVTITARPPENLAGSTHYSYATDVWSLGLLGLELFSSYPAEFGADYYLGLVSAYLATTGNRDFQQWSSPAREEYNYNRVIGFLLGRKLTDQQVGGLLRSRGKLSVWFDQADRADSIRDRIENPLIADLLVAMLQTLPEDRPTMEEILQRLDQPIEPAVSVDHSIVDDANVDSDLLRLHDELYRAEGEDLPSVALLQATQLLQRCSSLDVVTPLEQELLKITCLWLIGKLYGILRRAESLIWRSSDILDWDPELELVEGWSLKSWYPGQPLIPVALLIQERNVVEHVGGVLLT